MSCFVIGVVLTTLTVLVLISRKLEFGSQNSGMATVIEMEEIGQ